MRSVVEKKQITRKSKVEMLMNPGSVLCSFSIHAAYIDSV